MDAVDVGMQHPPPLEKFSGSDLGEAQPGKGGGKGKDGLQAYCWCKSNHPVTAAYKEECKCRCTTPKTTTRSFYHCEPEDILFSVRGFRG